VLEFVLSSFTALFVTINPINAAAIYPALTAGASREDQRRMAVRATLVASSLLLVFALCVIAANFIMDLLNFALDPRVRTS